MRSLFVLSLPRSLSSLVFRVGRDTLGLREPTWTTEGEILNLDRMAHYRGARFDECAKFTTGRNDPKLFRQTTDFLSQVVQPEGFVYKDVIQPFVVSAWPGLGELRVVKIRRDVAEVACSMLRQGWYYPQAASGADDLETALIEGLLRAEQAIDRAPGESIEYDALIRDEDSLRACLARLYPDREVPRLGYVDRPFAELRRGYRARRVSARQAEVRAKVAAIRAALEDRGRPEPDAPLRPAPAEGRAVAPEPRTPTLPGSKRLAERVRRLVRGLRPGAGGSGTSEQAGH